MTRVLVTGATGFVGGALCETLAHSGFVVRAALRSDRRPPGGSAEAFVIGDMASTVDWQRTLAGVDAVVHLAGRVHVLNDSSANETLYIESNVHGTRNLATATSRAGIRRFVYLSSVKVNGEETGNRAYTALDEPAPQDAYGKSKWQAELALAEVAAATALEAAVVRPTLVYGPGVRANFLRLMRWVDKERPLPLGAIHNRRSLVSVWNLCDLIVQLLKSPAAPGRTWMVSDGHDLSTPDLVRQIASAMNRRARFLPIPEGLLRAGGALIGRKAEVARLCGSLQVDISETRRLLGWTPPVTVEEGIARTVRWYLSEGRSLGT